MLQNIDLFIEFDHEYHQKSLLEISSNYQNIYFNQSWLLFKYLFYHLQKPIYILWRDWKC